MHTKDNIFNQTMFIDIYQCEHNSIVSKTRTQKKKVEDIMKSQKFESPSLVELEKEKIYIDVDFNLFLFTSF